MTTLTTPAEELIHNWPAKKCLQNNLDALKNVDEDLAQAIESVEPPADCQLTMAKDGSVTFQQKTANDKTQWLGKSSIPLIFSQANQERIDVGHGNMVMQGMGHGADVLATLENMVPTQALFVVEPELLTLHLAFQIRDFTQFINSRQLVILQGQCVSQLIEEFYQENPGYHIIQKATILPYYTQKENNTFASGVNTAMESSVAHLARKITPLLDEQIRLDQKRQPNECETLISSGKLNEIKVFHSATAFSETVISTARMALSGFAQSGAIVDATAHDKPDQASGYAQLQRMINVCPHLIILIDALRGDVSPTLPSSAICITLLRNPPERLLEKENSPANLLGPNDWLFPATLEQFEKYKEADYPADRIRHLPIAADTDTYKPVSVSNDESGLYTCDVALVASRLDTDPETYGIQLPTHQRLWRAIVAEICDCAGQYHCGMAQRVLRRAQSCGIKINEEELLTHFGKLIETVLSDAILRDYYTSYLVKQGLGLKIWGRQPIHPTLRHEHPNHWEQSVTHESVVGEIASGQPLNALYNTAKINLFISASGHVDQALLSAVAAGGFVLVKSHPDDKKPGGLADFFKIGKEIITFDTPNDLARKTKQYLREESARKKIAQAAHDRLLNQHTAQLRMPQVFKCFTGIGS